MRRTSLPTSLAVVPLLLTAAVPAALLVTAAPAPSHAQEAGALEQRVDSLMAEYDGRDSPGAVVGVVRGGEVAFAEGYGMADLAHGIPITPETRFNLGSISKQFMAFALALLESRGELSLDDPVSEHLPDWPRFEETVTLRHLLTHTSGYREAYGTSVLAGRIPGRDYLSREEALEVVRRQPALEFPAGSDWKYNSTAYVILDEIARRVTGEPSSEWMEENVFGPLGMDDTAIENEVGQVIPGAAYSYTGDAEEGYRLEFSNRAIFGAAEVYTTVGDLARWLRNFHTAGLGGEAVRDRMRERFVLTGGDTTDYALGLRIDRHRGLRRVGHGGSHAGFRAQLSYYPELDAGVVVMSNYDGVSAGGTAEAVAEIAFGEHMEPEEGPEPAAPAEGVTVDSALLARYSGMYRSEDGQIYRLEREDGRLELEGRVPLIPVSDSVFAAEDPPLTMTFHRGEDGTVTGATGRSGGEVRSLRRVEPWEPGPDDLRAYAGSYYSPELETVYVLRVADGGLVAEHRWHGRLGAEAGGAREDEFRLDRGIRIRFERNEAGTVTGFYASTGRTEGVWFGRRE